MHVKGHNKSQKNMSKKEHNKTIKVNAKKRKRRNGGQVGGIDPPPPADGKPPASTSWLSLPSFSFSYPWSSTKDKYNVSTETPDDKSIALTDKKDNDDLPPANQPLKSEEKPWYKLWGGENTALNMHIPKSSGGRKKRHRKTSKK